MVSVVFTSVLQLVLIGGIGGIVVVKYATEGIILPGEESRGAKPKFANEYDELMWLAEKQRGSLSEEEMLRFYQLRDKWPEMHLDPI